jgi:hypothetical protein
LKQPALVKYIIFSFQGAFARSIQIVADLNLLNRFYNFHQPIQNYIYQHIPDLRESTNSPDRSQKHTYQDL